MHLALRLPAYALSLLSLVACAPGRPKLLASAEGFQAPESVRYDSELDVLFVANINGNPNTRDNNGFISRLTPFGRVADLNFITGGRGDVTLNAPKGMAITGDTLWVADIDAVRAFNKRTGAPILSLDLSSLHAVFLNDVVAGPDGSLYITDTGIQFGATMTHPGPDRIFKIGPGWAVSVAAEGDTLGGPNGIAWDPRGGRFVIVPATRPTILGWTEGHAPEVIATGPGGYDGIEYLKNGRALVTSWADSSVYLLSRDGKMSRYIENVAAPADLGLDTKRNHIALPRFMANKVEIWEIR